MRVEPVADALGSRSLIILATPGIHDDAGIRALATSLGDVVLACTISRGGRWSTAC